MMKLLAVNSSVWPSAGALATTSAPMLPPAPGRLSTTQGWLPGLDMRSPNNRAAMSAALPAAAGTTMRTGLDG